MKSKRKIEDMLCETSSSMRWGSGEEVIANLDWDESRYYLWFEPTYGFVAWCEEVGGSMMNMLEDLRVELAKIGVQEFCDLEGVNSYCESKCGSDDPFDRAYFYVDDLLGVCGA